jgi:hypothetical protein
MRFLLLDKIQNKCQIFLTFQLLLKYKIILNENKTLLQILKFVISQKIVKILADTQPLLLQKKAIQLQKVSQLNIRQFLLFWE